MNEYIFSSVTRTSWLPDAEFEIEACAHDEWNNGDFVVAEVRRGTGRIGRAELRSGRRVDLIEGDRVVGCLGRRWATLAYCGSFEEVDDRHLDLLSTSGVFGRVVSRSPDVPPPIELEYLGHVIVGGRRSNLADFALTDVGGGVRVPVALIVGSSRDAGKTLVARLIIRRAVRAGARVYGTKLSGVGRLRDIQAMADAGAVKTFSFVDAGLPSTVTDGGQVAKMVDTVFSHISPDDCDLCIVEAGASPLERYNGDVVFDRLESNIAFTVLCAADPYAVAGVRDAFGFAPDLIAGRAAGTIASRELVERLTGDRPIDILDPDNLAPIDALLARCDIEVPAGSEPLRGTEHLAEDAR